MVETFLFDADDTLKWTIWDADIDNSRRRQAVAFLLGLGADPDQENQDGRKLDDSPNATIGVTYWLERARIHKRMKKDRLKEIGDKMPFPRLHYLPSIEYWLVGQRPATYAVHLAMACWAKDQSEGGAKRPLVLMLCGPSGHGKTEMGQRLAAVFGEGSDLLKVSCEQFSTKTELFGAAGAYQGAKEGSKLNNFIAQHHKKFGVVLLDEFEKIGERSAHEALLNVFDRGEWHDKQLKSGRSQTEAVDCSKLVFILTTNMLDDIVMKIGNDNPTIARADKETLDQVLHATRRETRRRISERFSTPFSGRLNAGANSVVPFFPFADSTNKNDPVIMKESDVLCDNFIEDELARLASKGNINANMPKKTRADVIDLARLDYVADEGFRSIQGRVNELVTQQFHKSCYFDEIDSKAHLYLDKTRMTSKAIPDDLDDDCHTNSLVGVAAPEDVAHKVCQGTEQREDDRDRDSDSDSGEMADYRSGCSV
ncbi:unnamed protein product [Vitrella brassicaformis CCMP3155]|uniref:AAA+ ATPase domain-containing protein n=3 Tax=Vitrella brassicaformis TaxID=1169539 RepID=A0A0G4GZA4_VITBC|nr:unnamed protein product [Vitrella brassicaformis CCMP3155]|eukprot:CEM36411.1 unnamed protein product [Vitrella brassicaformis CCMP3155]